MSQYESNCIFCDLLNNIQNETFVADFNYGRLLVNFSQTYYGRCMYIFKSHIKDISEVNIEDNNGFMLEMMVISKVLKNLFNFDKIDYATLGNEVPHYHWHLIPRYKTDSNYEQKSPWPHIKNKVSKEELQKLNFEIYKALIEYQDNDFIINEVSSSKRVLELERIPF